MRGIVPILGVVFALAFAGARAVERSPVHAEGGSVAIGALACPIATRDELNLATPK